MKYKSIICRWGWLLLGFVAGIFTDYLVHPGVGTARFWAGAVAAIILLLVSVLVELMHEN